MATTEYEFKAEINQLMNLIINTFYSNKDIFLRELISNASDALDKIRYQHLQSNNVGDNYSIKIRIDKDNNELMIQDSGIGMSQEELVENLGMIANSGTKKFMEMLKEDKSVDLIGQFGVGFYSAFLVADSVRVVSKKEDSDEVFEWFSDAKQKYTIKSIDNNDTEFHHGTKLYLRMKEEDTKYLDESTIDTIVKKHSNFVSYDILLEKSKEETLEKEKDEEEEEGDDVEVKEVKEEDEKPETKTVLYWDKINSSKPVWSKSTSEITEDEYDALFKSLNNSWDTKLTQKHFTAEGNYEFRGIVFIPKQPPFNMGGTNTSQYKTNMKLYVKKVFILDNCKDLVPEWLNFISGVVDCDNLPLNVSREMLQENKIISVMKKKIISKTIEAIQDLEEKDFDTFYSNYGNNIKLGIYSEESYDKEKLAKILRYHTNTSGDKRRSLEEYISNTKENQKDIYYLAGDTLENVKNSVFIEKLTKEGYEVLFMTDAIDEYMIQQLNKFNDYNFVSVAKEGLELNETKDDETEDKTKETNSDDEDDKELCKYIKDVLGKSVEKVIISKRLDSSPCCIVTDKSGQTANMERIMKAQAVQSNQAFGMMKTKKIFEINKEHSIIKDIQLQMSENTEDVKKTIQLLYNFSCVSSGFPVDNINDFSQQFFKILSSYKLNNNNKTEKEVEVEAETLKV